MMQIPGLYVAPSGKSGRGVFTASALRVGDLIEICPVIVIPGDQRPWIDQCILHDYYFLWDEEQGDIALALGYGMLYNHRKKANAEAERDLGACVIRIRCIESISAGEEIFINYNDHLGSQNTLWFTPE